MIKCVIFFFSLLLVLANAARAETRIVAGPIVGNVTESSARVWLQINTSDQVSVRAVDVVTGRSIGAVGLDVEGPSPFVADVPVSNLSPDRSYRLEILIAEKEAPIGEPLVVHTAPAAGQEAAFSIALAGGLDLSGEKKEVAAAEAIIKLKPQMALFLGDMGKLPEAEKAFPKSRREAFDLIAAMHQAVRNNDSMRPVFRKIPCLAVWGERDFGPENSDRSFVYARESMFAFRRYWPNPMYGTPEARGVFFNAQCGDADFFCLDARMQRDPASPAKDRKNFYGAGQIAWLKDQLKNSKAAVKVIASSASFLGDDPAGWASDKEEREDFIAFLQREKIGGVVFVSRGGYGQILCRKTKDDAFYPLYELVCPPLNVAAGKAGVEPLRVGEPTAENGFASLNFGGTKNKRFVTLQIRDEKGGIKQDQTLFTGNLQAP